MAKGDENLCGSACEVRTAMRQVNTTLPSDGRPCALVLFRHIQLRV